MMKKGIFITFEGIDGCGKTTQINLLNEFLSKKGYQTFLTLEPGAGKIGKSLRNILLNYEGFVADNCELFLYLADRSQHVEETIKPNVEEGKIVLCDRYTDSTIAYQGYGRKGDVEKLTYLNDIATNKFYPDLTFVFDIDIETSQQRIGKNKDRLEKESFEFHKRVKEGYKTLAKQNPKRIKVIQANQSIEQIHKIVIDELSKTFKEKFNEEL